MATKVSDDSKATKATKVTKATKATKPTKMEGKADGTKTVETKKVPDASVKGVKVAKDSSVGRDTGPRVARAAKASPSKHRPPKVSERQREHYIEVAAFYIAERRSFSPGDALTDWLAAEAEVDRLIAEGKLGN